MSAGNKHPTSNSSENRDALCETIASEEEHLSRLDAEQALAKVQSPGNPKKEGRDGIGIPSNVAAFRMSGRQDLNLRPLGPEPSALPG